MTGECPNCKIPLHGTYCSECRTNWKYLVETGSACNVGDWTCSKCGATYINAPVNSMLNLSSRL